jgi:tripartite-type tricarboxylate transporter receptor subunit TctC
VTDLLSGNVQLMFSSYATVAAHMREGKLRALATTLPSRSPLMPEIPTLVEAGFPPLPMASWAGLLGPARMPKDVTDRLNRELVALLNRADVRENLNKQAFDGRSSSVEEFTAYMKSQYEIWGKAIRDAGIQPD